MLIICIIILKAPSPSRRHPDFAKDGQYSTVPYPQRPQNYGRCFIFTFALCG